MPQALKQASRVALWLGGLSACALLPGKDVALFQSGGEPLPGATLLSDAAPAASAVFTSATYTDGGTAPANMLDASLPRLDGSQPDSGGSLAPDPTSSAANSAGPPNTEPSASGTLPQPSAVVTVMPTPSATAVPATCQPQALSLAGANPNTLFTFESNNSGFVLQSEPQQVGSQLNLFTECNVNMRAECSPMQLEHSEEVGPDSQVGLLAWEAPFFDYEQFARIQVCFQSSDLRGTRLDAWLKIAGGLSPEPEAPGGAYLYARSGAEAAWAQGPWIDLIAFNYGTWVSVYLELDAPAEQTTGFNASEVHTLGIHLSSGPQFSPPFEARPVHVHASFDQVTLTTVP